MSTSGPSSSEHGNVCSKPLPPKDICSIFSFSPAFSHPFRVSSLTEYKELNHFGQLSMYLLPLTSKSTLDCLLCNMELDSLVNISPLPASTMLTVVSRMCWSRVSFPGSALLPSAGSCNAQWLALRYSALTNLTQHSLGWLCSGFYWYSTCPCTCSLAPPSSGSQQLLGYGASTWMLP